MADADQNVPFVTLTVKNFNPNHRVRFVGLALPIRYLFDLSSAVGDDSFYLAPKLARSASIEEQQPDGSVAWRAPVTSGDFHVSFHESGAVNLHLAATKRVLCPAGEGRGQQGLALRLVFNSLELFQTASPDEFNALPKRYTPIPILGFWKQYPIYLDIYQCARDESWSMPRLGDIVQVHVRVQPVRKSSDYHFLVWQHSKAECYSSDVALLYSPLTSSTP